MEWLQSQQVTYGLSEDVQQRVLRECRSKGYGYTDYAHQSGFGISLVTHERMRQLAADVGGVGVKRYSGSTVGTITRTYTLFRRRCRASY